MKRFGLTNAELLAAVKTDKNDADAVAWFGPDTGNDDQQKKDRNEFSVNLGNPDQPTHKTPAWATKEYHLQCDGPGVDNIFPILERNNDRMPRLAGGVLREPFPNSKAQTFGRCYGYSPPRRRVVLASGGFLTFAAN
jgi:hypothetical protein